ncbi:hypothetical protein HDU80_005004 [Chytriomyces hyalinus]|nr:hypothetical protein HDU80_005004 [Chytriomyces hyalinus]
MLPIPDAFAKLPKRPRVLVIILAGSVTVLLVYLLTLRRDTTLGQGQMQIPEQEITEVCNAHSTACNITVAYIASDSTTPRSNKSSKSTPTSTNTRLTTGRNPSVLYYNTHGGTNVNMKGIMKALNLDMSIFNPKQVTGYGMSGKHAAKLINMGHVSHICESYDVVVIGDTIPHGRALMQSLLEWSPAKQCRSVVVVEMTNRFDWDVKDKSAYYQMVRDLVRKGQTTLKNRLYWVANNNVEQAYVEFMIGMKMPDVRVLRPVGISKDYPYPDDLPPQDEKSFASRTHDTTNIFAILKDEFDIPLTIFPFGHKYGGPKNLLAFKGFIDIPYQYSVMKFYENIAYGVPMFVPTPRLFEYMLQSGLHYTHCIFPNLLKRFPSGPDMKVKTVPGFPPWSAYMDYYDPLFAPYVYYFDSFVELQNMRSFTRAELDWKNVAVEGPKFYNAYRDEILEGWASMFRDMGYRDVQVQAGGAGRVEFEKQK